MTNEDLDRAAEALYDHKYPQTLGTAKRRPIKVLLDECRREVNVVANALEDDGQEIDPELDPVGAGIQRGL